MSDIQKKVIQVQSVESTDKKTVLKDQDGKKFNVWHTKKDGTPSKASLTMSQYGVKTGSTIEVSYTEEDFEMNGKTLKTKRVMSFAPTSANPSPAALYSGQGAQGTFHSDTFGEILGTQGIFQAYVSTGKVDLSNELSVADAINHSHAACLKLRTIVTGASTPSFAASLTTPKQAAESMDEELNVEDVPF